jgi:hypothetical protein
LGTLARKAQRTGKANTGKTAGDNRHPSLEVLQFVCHGLILCRDPMSA